MIEQLIAGYQRFKQGYFQENQALLQRLADEGQNPRVAIIACCDSRVDPSLMLDCSPGDLFIVRNVANLVPPCEASGAWHGTSAALQFAVCGLNVEHIVVLGHTQCGGIKSMFDDQEHDEMEFIRPWMLLAGRAKQTVLANPSIESVEDRVHQCGLESIKTSLGNLLTFPWISEKIRENKLQIHGWHYDIATAQLLSFDSVQGAFHAVDQKT
ncbi:MAG: carbonic anhydrase [Zetaproteobacteria bacterium]|nr:carbonic anhydrase [Zetaproteobacteria bacterium]